MSKVMNDEIVDEAYKIIVDNGNKFINSKNIYNLLSPKTKETIKLLLLVWLQTFKSFVYVLQLLVAWYGYLRFLSVQWSLMT